MDLTLFIVIVLAIVVIYLFIKFILSPVLRIIFGIIIFIILIYFLQRFFGFDLNRILSPFGISLNLNKLYLSISWILLPINYLIDQVKNFLIYIWGNIPKFS